MAKLSKKASMGMRKPRVCTSKLMSTPRVSCKCSTICTDEENMSRVEMTTKHQATTITTTATTTKMRSRRILSNITNLHHGAIAVTGVAVGIAGL
jgi:hypothetical protein